MSMTINRDIPSDLAYDFKQAMRRLTSSVSIITTSDDEIYYGMVATAVNAVCMSPPSILISVNESASLLRPLLKKARFTVNVLDISQHGLISTFSDKNKRAERFNYGIWSEFEGLPILCDSQASLVCSIDQQIKYGSHVIVIGKVEMVIVAENISPLLWQDGKPAASVPFISSAIL